MPLTSFAAKRGHVTFPEFTGERVYMREFYATDGLPHDLARWTPTVEAMLDGVDTDGPLYLMVDQSVVQPGTAQRRPGAHIDGYWHPAAGQHFPGGHRATAGHRPSPGRHTPAAPAAHAPYPRHFPVALTAADSPTTWEDAHLRTDWAPEGLLLASDVAASRAYVGEWDGPIREGGDCSAVDLTGLTQVDLDRNVVWSGNVTMLHESLPLPAGGQRTLVRLNVPGWSPELAA